MRCSRPLALGYLLLVFWPWPSLVMAQDQAESCVTCHVAIDVDRLTTPAKEFTHDIHAEKGFGCVSCHGGDAKEPGMEAMDPAKGYIGKPEGVQIVQVCGRCHSDARFMQRYNPTLRIDQVAEYSTSEHGWRLRELADAKVATCVSCHTTHAIRPPADPQSSVHPLRVAETCGSCHADSRYMEAYTIPTDQLQKYKRSVHWKILSVKGDLAASTCNDCHGNHGAAPPGVSWVGNVCGQCHGRNAELFTNSPHATIFIQLGTPGCATCHNNHDIQRASDAMLGLGDRAVCAACHTDQDRGGEVAVEMRQLIDTLKRAYEQAHAILGKAERAGMEVSQAQFELNEAKTALVQSRATIHAFKVEPVKKEVERGLAISQKAYTRGVQALEELQFRRQGLTVSVVIVLALIGGLLLKIRQMERGR